MKNYKTKSLSINEWINYIEKGINIPITIKLNGTSMEPLIRYMKDSVNIIPIPSMSHPLSPGDIILFIRQDGSYVVHRIYQIDSVNNLLQTWGDNCYQPDLPIPVSSVLGYVISCNKNGRIINFDTNTFRTKGIQWMQNSFKRRLWFFYRKVLFTLSK